MRGVRPYGAVVCRNDEGVRGTAAQTFRHFVNAIEPRQGCGQSTAGPRIICNNRAQISYVRIECERDKMFPRKPLASRKPVWRRRVRGLDQLRLQLTVRYSPETFVHVAIGLFRALQKAINA
jgi:hypothetical protein